MADPINTNPSFISYFKPTSSSHHALDQFNKLSLPKRLVVILAATLGSIIPVAGTCAVFRKVTYLLAGKGSPTTERTHDVGQSRLSTSKEYTPKELIWTAGTQNINDSLQNLIEAALKKSPLVKDKRVVVFASVSNRFQEMITQETTSIVNKNSVLVVLRWGNNVARGDSSTIAIGWEKYPIIQIEYDDTHAKILA